MNIQGRNRANPGSISELYNIYRHPKTEDVARRRKSKIHVKEIENKKSYKELLIAKSNHLKLTYPQRKH